MTERRRKKAKPEDTPPPAPSNPEAEAALLGLILCDQRRFHDVADSLRADDFSKVRNQTIWRGMCSLVATGRHIERHVLGQEIGDEDGSEDEIDLKGYLRALFAEGQKQTLTIADLLEVVRAAAIMREGIAHAEWLKEQFSAARITSIEDVLAEAKHRLSLIGTGNAEDATAIGGISEAVVGASIKIRNKELPAGLKTGLKFIDGLVGSLKPGQLVVVGGPPGAGKSALVAQILYVLAHEGMPSHLFSPEMVGEEIAARMLASLTSISGDKITEGDVTDEQMMGIVDASRSMRDIPFYVDDRSRPTTSSLMSRASRSMAKNGTKIFATDHLRKVISDVKRGDERERLEQIVADHKDMAKRLGVPWILAAHVKRPDMTYIKTAKDIRRPNMHDLYGSSAVENEADIVLFVHRPEVILLDAKPAPNAKHYDEWHSDLLKCEGKAEIILAKRRGGKGRGIRQCRYDAERTWFREKDDQPAYTGEAPT